MGEARDKAIDFMTTASPESLSSFSQARVNAAMVYAILDLADAVREHAEAVMRIELDEETPQ